MADREAVTGEERQRERQRERERENEDGEIQGCGEREGGRA